MTYLPTQSFYNEHFKLTNTVDQFFFYHRSFLSNNRTDLAQITMTVYSLFKDFTPANVKHLLSWLFLQEQLFGTPFFRFSLSKYKFKRDHRISVTLVCELTKNIISLKLVPLLVPTAYGNQFFSTLSTNRYSTIGM